VIFHSFLSVYRRVTKVNHVSLQWRLWPPKVCQTEAFHATWWGSVCWSWKSQKLLVVSICFIGKSPIFIGKSPFFIGKSPIFIGKSPFFNDDWIFNPRMLTPNEKYWGPITAMITGVYPGYRWLQYINPYSSVGKPVDITWYKIAWYITITLLHLFTSYY